jgi:hypothetical protein
VLLGVKGHRQVDAKQLARKLKVQNNRSIAAAAVERGLQEQKDSAAGHFCDVKGCTRWYWSAKWLRKHQDDASRCPDGGTSSFRSSSHSGKKGSGVTPVHMSSADMMKRVIANTSKIIVPGSPAALLAGEIDTARDGISIGGARYVLIDGANFDCPTGSVGMAEKKHMKGASRFTLGQLDFLKWCYMRGVMNKANKMSPKQAEDAMELHGTTAGAIRYPNDPYCARRADGTPAFRIGELLEHWTFRSWFGQQKAAFEKKIAGQVLKAAASFHELVAAAGDDEEEEDGE